MRNDPTKIKVQCQFNYLIICLDPTFTTSQLEKKNMMKHCRHRRLLYSYKCFLKPSLCLWILSNYQVLPRKLGDII